LLSQLKEYRLGITALQETRWQGKDIMDMKPRTLFYSGKEEGTRQLWVAFIVERSMKRNILDFKAVDERICILKIKTKFHNTSFINVHAPTEENEEIEKEAFYQKVEEVYDACPSNDIKILLGDLNAKVGREEIYQGLIRRHSMHLNTNNNGQRLVEFAAAKNTVVSSICFPQKEIHKQTWRPPDGKTNNKTDHILIDKRNASSIQDVKSCRGASSDSDHFLVRVKYRCKIGYSKQKPNRNAKKFHVETLTEPSTAMRFQQIGKEFEKTENERAADVVIHLEEEWKRIKEVIVEAAEQTIGYQPKPDRRGWFDDERRLAVDEKNIAYKKWIDRPTRNKRQKYERLRKVAHKTCKNKERAHTDNCIRNIEENIKDKHIRNPYKEVGSLKGGFKPHTDLCRGINNEILANAEDIKTRWRAYFQDLLNTAVAEHDSFLDNSHINQIATEEELEEEPPSTSDIEIAIQSMSNNKSPGIDNIPAEFYKKRYLLMNNVHRLIKGIWIEEKVPKDWKMNIIVPIYKNKGDKLQCKNYTGISLLCTGYKILTRVINSRLKKYTNTQLVNTRQDLDQGSQLLIKFLR
jgi:endonuclease/exonuclease/phosphatase family metal-dependent hydrolase